MSVETSLKPQSGFLREFHFTLLAKRVVKKLLGEIDPHWIRCSFEAAPDKLRFGFNFTIKLRFLNYDRLYTIRGLKGLTTYRRIEGSRSRVIGFFMEDERFVQSAQRVPDLVCQGVESALLDSAYRLYEFDPRIGWQHGVEERDSLPMCPLFDPPQPFSRTGLARGNDYPERCAFCDLPCSSSPPPVWAGANLMWVHADCWVLDEPFDDGGIDAKHP